MSEVRFYQASQDLENPNADCKSLKTGQLLLLNHPAAQVVDTHTHEEAHLIFVRQGKINFQVQGQTYAMAAGDTLVVPPNTPHSFTVIGDSPCRTACLSI